MSDILTIPSVESNAGVVQYQIQLKVPLRQVNVSRRYSEFQVLLDQLSDEAGVRVADFPYQLPPKQWIKLNTGLFIEERRQELSVFLNKLIRDTEFQNSDHLRAFLRLPQSFKFNAAVFKQEKDNLDDESKGVSNFSAISIDTSVWLEVLRLADGRIGDISRELKSNTKDTLYTVSIRQELMRLIRPTVENLRKTLVENELSSNEYRRRKLLLTRLEESVETLTKDLNRTFETSKEDTYSADRQALLSGSSGRIGGKRVLGGPAEETKDTMPLNNQELLQYQQQIQQNQDQEILQLRGVIARQKQISTAIYTEVEEQNQLLDMLHSEVDSASDKLAKARTKAKKIL